jgi:hypothetical protein
MLVDKREMAREGHKETEKLSLYNGLQINL